MTDRINSFTVVLDHDIRVDDVEPIVNAIRCIKHVMVVEQNVASASDFIAEERARMVLGSRVIKAVREAVYPERAK